MSRSGSASRARPRRVAGSPSRLLVLTLALATALSAAWARPAAAYFEETFEQRFFFEEDGLVTDHTLISVPGDGYHLFYTIGRSGEGWMFPGNMVDFGHATSPDLIEWTIHPRVLGILDGTWKDRNVWAPHVLPDPPDGYLMAYTGLDSFAVQATGLARSNDLFAWTDLSVDAPAYYPDPAWSTWAPGVWSDGRDPYVWRLGEGFLMLNTASASDAFTGSGVKGAISIAQSTGGDAFVDLGSPLFVNDSNRVLESTSIYRRPNLYYLFYHENNQPGIRYMTSTSLFSGWDKSNAKVLDAYAFGPSEVTYTGSTTLFSRVIDVVDTGTLVYGAKIDTLHWTSDTVYYGLKNTLWDQWQVVEGDAFEHQPVFGDLPAARGAPASQIVDHFWINTAETYNGPLDIRDPEEPPDYAATGVLRSAPFLVTGGHITLRVGGGDDLENLRVALVDAVSDEVLAASTGSDSNELHLQTWDLSGLAGRPVAIEIVDRSTDAPLGYIAVDHIREGPSSGVGVGDPGAAAFPRPGLGVPFPNPVRRGARVTLQLARPGRARLALYDVQGRLRRLLFDRRLDAGAHLVAWDGRDARGREMEAGVYFLRLEAGGTRSARKVVVGD